MSASTDRTHALGLARAVAERVSSSVSPGVVEHVHRALRADAFVRAGRHAAAERLLRDVAAALQRRRAWVAYARVRITLGRLLLERGRSLIARDTFADAVAAVHESGDPVAHEAALWEVAALTDGDCLDEAERRSLALDGRADLSPPHRAWARACLARVALWRGDVSAAHGFLPARESHDDAIVAAWIEATAVRTLVATGDLFAAGLRAQEPCASEADSGAGAGADRGAEPGIAGIIGESARLRLLCACGDLDGAAASLARIVERARAARAPLRLVRARLVYVSALRRGGRHTDADRVWRTIRHALRVAPPLLRAALERHGNRGVPQRSPARPRPARPPVSPAASLMPELMGRSAALDDVRRAVTRAAGAPFAVLIEGESGVGKELVARAIHRLSPRAAQPFRDVNCAALPDDLIESELFGHARGAFTGALSDRAGLFEDANGGSLFLDEVPELSPRAQAKLLRVLQQQEVRRLGETTPRPIDVRVVSAANRAMAAEAAAHRFRADLLYRLDVIHLRVPPLRERPEDIALLAEAFWHACAARVATRATLGDDVMRTLAAYAWPGNVRQLQNAIAALAVMAPSSGRVPASLLPAYLVGESPPLTLAAARDGCDRRAVQAALARAGGRRVDAARLLGVTRQGLLKLMARLERTAHGSPADVQSSAWSATSRGDS